MPEKENIVPAPGSEVTEPAESNAAAPVEKTEAGKEETIGEVLNPGEAKKEAETVPLSALIDLKKTDKEQKKQIKELQKKLEDGVAAEQAAPDIDALVEEFPDLDPKFLKKFVALARAEAKKEAEEEVSSKLKPIREKETADAINTRFETHFAKVLEAMPEYAKIVNKDVIKTLSLSPKNANKTFTQIIEESYGHLVTGKRTIDAGSPRAGKDNDAEVDTARAAKDPAYFKEVMADPVRKKKYNDDMFGRISSQF